MGHQTEFKEQVLRHADTGAVQAMDEDGIFLFKDSKAKVVELLVDQGSLVAITEDEAASALKCKLKGRKYMKQLFKRHYGLSDEPVTAVTADQVLYEAGRFCMPTPSDQHILLHKGKRLTRSNRRHKRRTRTQRQRSHA